ncbi:MAG: NADH-quinone oxidoreductase subunit NuoK [Spirochaetia bacterium]|nr:NADH-quinone oxidoreductase subunit NuoK [Spirochaetia bacterium]
MNFLFFEGISQNPNSYLILAIIIFCAGIFTVLTRKNIIGILLGIELMLNAGALNFIAFSFFRHESADYSGHVFAIFVIVLAAAEAVVALAILLAVYQQRRSVSTDDISDLKG